MAGSSSLIIKKQPRYAKAGSLAGCCQQREVHCRASNAARATASAALRPLHSSSPSHRLPAPAAVQRASSPPTPTPSPPPSSVLRTARLMPPSPPRSAWCHPRSDPPHIRDQKIPARTRWTARRRDGRPAGPFRRAIERTPHAPRRRPSKHGPCLLPPRLLSARPPAAPAGGNSMTRQQWDQDALASRRRRRRRSLRRQYSRFHNGMPARGPGSRAAATLAGVRPSLPAAPSSSSLELYADRSERPPSVLASVLTIALVKIS